MRLKVDKPDQRWNAEIQVYYSEEHIYTFYIFRLDEHLSIGTFFDNLYWIIKPFNSSEVCLRSVLWKPGKQYTAVNKGSI